MIDLLVLRKPVVKLPRRAALGVEELPDGQPNPCEPLVKLPRRAALGVEEQLDGQPDPRSGLGRLKDFSVITELKVSATQIEGPDYTEVVRDFEKLSAILSAAEHPDAPLPRAYVGIFNNRVKPRFNFAHLQLTPARQAWVLES